MVTNLTREYQRKCRDTILEKWNSKEKQLGYCVLPTGTGKTRIFMNLDLPEQKRTLILVEKIALMEQLTENCDEDSILMIGNSYKPSLEDLEGCKVVVSTVQTLSKENYLSSLDKDLFDLIIIDECHHASVTNNCYKTITDYFNYRLCVGFTATPSQYSSVFSSNQMWYTYSIYDAWNDGYLVKPKCYLLELNWDRSKLDKALNRKSHQWTDSEVSNALTTHAANNFEIILEQLKKVNNAERSVVYFPSKALANGFAEYCNDNDYECYSITSDTTSEERQSIVATFKESRNVILSNVYILTEGIDIPQIETVLIARPTENVNLYKQIVGRALRTADNKTGCNIIDCFVEQSDYLFQQTFATAYLESNRTASHFSRDFVESLVEQLNQDGDVEKLNSYIEGSIDVCYNLIEMSRLYVNTYGVPYYIDEEKNICYGGCSLYYGSKYTDEKKIRFYIDLEDSSLHINMPPYNIKFSTTDECFKHMYDNFYSDNRCSIPFSKGGGGERLSVKQQMLLIKLVQEKYNIAQDLSAHVINSLSKKKASELISKLLIEDFIKKYMLNRVSNKVSESA